MRDPLAVRREQAGIENGTPNVLYAFEHET